MAHLATTAFGAFSSRSSDNKMLWRECGRQQQDRFAWLRRLVELKDRLNQTIAELTQAIEREVEKCAEAATYNSSNREVLEIEDRAAA
jgi:hypothetical protein